MVDTFVDLATDGAILSPSDLLAVCYQVRSRSWSPNTSGWATKRSWLSRSLRFTANLPLDSGSRYGAR